MSHFLKPWMSFLHLCNGMLDHSSFANGSWSFRFECLLPAPTSVLWESSLGIFQISPLLLLRAFSRVFRVVSLLEERWTLVETQLSWCTPKFFSLDFMRTFTQSRHPVPKVAKHSKTSFKKKKKKVGISSLSFKASSFSARRTMMFFSKNRSLFIPLCEQWFPPGSVTAPSLFIHMVWA